MIEDLIDNDLRRRDGRRYEHRRNDGDNPETGSIVMVHAALIRHDGIEHRSIIQLSLREGDPTNQRNA